MKDMNWSKDLAQARTRAKHKFRLRVSGFDLQDFREMLTEQEIPIPFEIYEELKPSGESVESYRFFDTLPAAIPVGIVSAIIIQLTKETIKAILNWLKERRKKSLREPLLTVTVEGDVLSLDPEDMKALAVFLEQASKRSKPERRSQRRKKSSAEC